MSRIVIRWCNIIEMAEFNRIASLVQRNPNRHTSTETCAWLIMEMIFHQTAGKIHVCSFFFGRNFGFRIKYDHFSLFSFGNWHITSSVEYNTSSILNHLNETFFCCCWDIAAIWLLHFCSEICNTGKNNRNTCTILISNVRSLVWCDWYVVAFHRMPRGQPNNGPKKENSIR